MKLYSMLQRYSQQTASSGTIGDQVTREVVESVDKTDRVTLKGIMGFFTCTGRYRPKPGDVVPLLWKKGTPLVIIAHRTRRALNTATPFPEVAGLVEQLLVHQPAPINGVAQPVDVYYRNHDQFVPLNITPYLKGQTPQSVKWGADGNSFGVACSGGFYAVFAFTRKDPDVYSDFNPGTIKFLYFGKPLTGNTTLVTVSFYNQRQRIVKYFSIKVQSLYKWVKRQIWYAYAAYCWAWVISDDVETSHGWEAGGTATATANASTSETFGVQDALQGKTDRYGSGYFSGHIMDWFVDSDRRLKILFYAEWENYRGQNSSNAMGTATVPWGAGPYGMDSWDFQVYAWAAISVVGGRKRSDYSYVPESHIFVIDGQTDAVLWGSAPSAVMAGWKGATTGVSLAGHYLTNTPAEPSGSAGEPSCTGSYLDPGHELKPEKNTESYYGGANWAAWTVNQPLRNEGNIGDDRVYFSTSTDTFQLISPNQLQCLRGPYKLESGKYEYIQTSSILLPWAWGAGFFQLQYSTTQGGVSALWFHRVAYAKSFVQNKEVRLFIVVERYPFISGTGYINDIPQLWIGVIDLMGAVKHTLRDWSYGYAGAQFMDANNYHILWILSTGWFQQRGALMLTNLHTPQTEVKLNLEQYSKVRMRELKLYAPDFVHTEQEDGTFVNPDPLQALTDIEDLKPYASLAFVGKTDGQTQKFVTGQNRIINDLEILRPLGYWRES